MKKSILVIMLFTGTLMTACKGNNGTGSAANDSASSSLEMSRKTGNNNGGKADSASLGNPDSAVNRSDTPRMSN